VVGDERKRRRVRVLQRYLLNPPVLVAAWAGLVPGYVLIETQGRSTGKRRRTVVGMYIEASSGWVVAEQGRHAGYVRNIEVNPNVRVRIGRRWRPACARLVVDDDPHVRLRAFNRPTHAATIRRFGTDLVSVRVDFTSA
jgi:deazaflavin-dependent oxidoreductase (nitroreductase family)